MTKPMNFPERKRQRQIKALDRLEEAECPADHPKPEIWVSKRKHDLQVLSDAVATSKRDVKTKKQQSA